MDLSPRSNGRVYLVTFIGTLICVAVTLFVDSFNWGSMNDEGRLRSIIIDFLLPPMLSVPVIYFFMSKLRELAVAHERLAIFASTDALTGMLNRGAFTTLVDSRLDQHPADGTPLLGAVLIMDVDNFKAINDQHGHEHGDTALQLISKATRAVLRQTDLLGRIGGEEFAILLEGADQPIAEAIAERIRLAVTDIPFSPQGRLHPLSVSVGGVVFDRRVPLSDLLRIADRELYAAKRDGRNRVAISPIADFGSVPAAAE